MSGPRNPSQPVGPVATLSPSVMCQSYEDGRLYQISSPRGRSFLAVVLGLGVIPEKDMDKAELFSVINPYDNKDYDDDLLYFSLWVSSN